MHDLADMIQSAADELAIARTCDAALLRLLHLGCALEYLAAAKQLVRRIERPSR